MHMMNTFQALQLARQTQISIYQDSRSSVTNPEDLIELFSPESACDFLNVKLFEPEEIPGDNECYEIAGLFDRGASLIAIARKYPERYRRFTGIHEVAHYLLHPGMNTLHRDRPLDHVRPGKARNPIERQADQFAACWLMPEKLVREQFTTRFGANTLRFDENAAFWLGIAPEAVRRLTHDERAMRVATARQFGGRMFQPLDEFFKVSTTAMAIRLKELNLL